jgi:hemolysin activation/secretion protein
MKVSTATFLFGMLTSPLALSAQTYEQVAPKVPSNSVPAVLPESPTPSVATDTRVVVAPLRGLVFVSSATQVRAAGTEASGVQIESLPVLDTPEFHTLAGRYLGQSITFAKLNELTREVVLYCRHHDRPIVDVLVPEQNVSTGTIQLIVLEGHLAKLAAEGNRFFSTRQILGPVRLRSGAVIAGQQLMEDLTWINQNPFRQVDLVFSRGEKPGETDVTLRTKDRRPLRGYAGYEDSGNALTGYDRYQVGLNWGNAFGLDHLFNYQLTLSGDDQQLVAHSGSYVTPIERLRHVLTVFGSYATSEPKLPGGFFTLAGRTWQVSARYRIPLKSVKGLTHDLTAGVDFKRSNNDLGFGGTRVFAQETDVVQAVIAYSASRPDAHGDTSANLSLFVSPGGVSSANHTSRYQAARSYADPEYVDGRLALERNTRLPHGFVWTSRATAQIASSNLLGSEQLGAGGYDTVRGYDEREANGDEGVLFSTELRGPGVSFGEKLKLGVPDRLVPLVFLDYGLVRNHRRLPAEPTSIELASAGLGLRYQLSTYVSARVDYGWQLKENEFGRNHRGRGHVGITISF